MSTLSSSTRNEKFIAAKAQQVYNAFTDPKALEIWMAPDEMTGKIHRFDLRVGGGYEMSLYYPDSEKNFNGKSAEKEDRYVLTYHELDVPKKIIASTRFVSDKPEFANEEMIMEVTLEEKDGGTNVVMVFKNLPKGLNPKGNEEGTTSSLNKLEKYLRGKK